MKRAKILIVSSVIIIFLLIIVGCKNANEAKKDDLNQIKKRGALIVATSADYPPYDFSILENGKNKIVGVDIDLAKAIAKGLGVKLEIKNMQFDSVLASVSSGRADIAISGLNITKEHQKSYDFSVPYYHAGQVALINKKDAHKYTKLADFNEKQILVQQASVCKEVAEKQLPKAKIVTTDTVFNGIMQLQARKAVALILDKPTAEGYADNNS
ncbi:MAG: transporter substrate-binding domain-containing protein, partial [Lactobacillales bacterium]|nr:transporter substrate-binding domain-containing protein [Lactobacillales bacterium]